MFLAVFISFPFFCGGESCLYETGSDAGVVWIPYERQMSDWMAALFKILYERISKSNR